MKKAGSIALVLAMVCAMLAGVVLTGCAATEEAAADEQLIVYNWGDYIDESIIDSFEVYYAEATGKTIEVVYSMFDTNEIMLTNLEKGEETIDLVCPSEYAIQRLMQKGLIKKLDKSKIANDVNVDDMIYTKVDEVFTAINVPGVGETEKMSDYFVPYMWGTLGILYNTDVVTEADLAKGYGLLWNAAGNEKLNGKILMKDSIRDAYVAAVLYLKETGRLGSQYASLSIENLINTIDDELLNEVQEVLIEQGEVLSGYEVDFGKADMTSGKAYVDLAWSGDALWAMEDADNLNYFVPEIGGNIWFDGWVMPKTAQNEAAAYMFLDYLCRPDVAMSNSMAIGYTSAVDKEVLRNDADAIAILIDNEYDVEEFFADEIRYPEATEKLGVMKDFGDMNEAAVTIWENVKSSNQSLLWILWVVLGVVGAAAIGVAIYFLVVKKKGSRRVVRKPVAKADDDGAEEETAESGEGEDSESDK